MDKVCLPTREDFLSVVPATAALATLERNWSANHGKGLVIRKWLQKHALFDFVIIDTPPLLGVLMINALAACDHLIIPCQTEFLALYGLERTMSTLAMVAKHHGFSVTLVPTFFDKRTRASVDSLRLLRQSYPQVVWPSYIPIDTKLRDAARTGLTPVSLPSRGVEAYQRLLKYFVKQHIFSHHEPIFSAESGSQLITGIRKGTSD